MRKSEDLQNLDEVENKEKVQNRLQRILEKIKNFINDGVDKNVIGEKITFSAGIRIGSTSEMKAMQLEADELLYKAKENGRNRSALSWSNEKKDYQLKEIGSNITNHQ